LFLGRRYEPAGFILSRKAADEAEILSVAIAAGWRGRGHSGPLLDRHLQSIAQAGVRSVFLEVEEGNRPALALYRRRGFREVGHRQGYYARPDGTRAAAITMSRRL
ncbi:MAG: GNAT family N-acetyltransferase, partial [Microvirga sp.]